MKWNNILGFILALMFVSMLFTPKAGKFAFLNEYQWEKYELNGMRTEYGDQLVMRFFPRQSIVEMKYNNDRVTASYRMAPDSTFYMMNTFFFPDTNISLIKGVVYGENDILIYPHTENLYFDIDPIYMKKRLPDQY